MKRWYAFLCALLLALLLAGCKGAPEALPTSFPHAVAQGSSLYIASYKGLVEYIDGIEQRDLTPEAARSPVIVGDWCYYIHDTYIGETSSLPYADNNVSASTIMRLRLRETTPEALHTEPYIRKLAVQDGRIFFNTSFGEGNATPGLFSIDLRGGDKRLLAPDCDFLFSASEGKLFFFGDMDGTPGLFAIEADGANRSMLYEGASLLSLYAAREWVYFVTYRADTGAENSRLFRVRHTGGEPEQLTNDAVFILFADDTHIYYDDFSENTLIDMDITTKEKTALIRKRGESIAVTDTYAAAYKSPFPDSPDGREILFLERAR